MNEPSPRTEAERKDETVELAEPLLASATYVVGCRSFSDADRRRLDLAGGLAKREGAVLLVVSIVTPQRTAYGAAGFPINVGTLIAFERRRADSVERDLRAYLCERRFPGAVERRSGQVVKELERVAREVGADKIFVGCGGRVAARVGVGVAQRLRRRASGLVVAV